MSHTAFLRTLVYSFNKDGSALAVCTNDGRIKIWNVLNGSIITELTVSRNSLIEGNESVLTARNDLLTYRFSSIAWKDFHPTPPSSTYSAKKKVRNSTLVVGTSNGEIFAFDSTLGSLKWKILDCHSSEVSSVSFLSSSSDLLYTCGKDGYVCQINAVNGTLLSKHKISKKALTSMAISPDGDKILLGGADISLYDLSSKKEIFKFSGHTMSTKCIAYSPCGKFAFSSSTNERDVVIWKCDDLKPSSQSAFATLSMEHPAIHLECSQLKIVDQPTSSDLSEIPKSEVRVCLVAISMEGEAYVWNAPSISELKSHKPIRIRAKISQSSQPDNKKPQSRTEKRYEEKIFGIKSSDVGKLTIARGSSVSPVFDFLNLDDMVEGEVFKLKIKLKQVDTASVPNSKNNDSTTVDSTIDFKETGGMLVSHVSGGKDKEAEKKKKRGSIARDAEDEETRKGENEKNDDITRDLPSLEEELRSRGVQMGELERRILLEKNNEDTAIEGKKKEHSGEKDVIPFLRIDSFKILLTQALLSDDVAFFDKCFSIRNEKLVANTVSKLNSVDAVKLFVQASEMLQSNHQNQGNIMLWIKQLLLNHAAYFANSPSLKPIFTEILQTIESHVAFLNPLMSLHGKLELMAAQTRARNKTTEILNENEETVEVAIYEDKSDEEFDHAQDAINDRDEDEEAADDDDEDEDDDDDNEYDEGEEDEEDGFVLEEEPNGNEDAMDEDEDDEDDAMDD